MVAVEIVLRKPRAGALRGAAVVIAVMVLILLFGSRSWTPGAGSGSFLIRGRIESEASTRSTGSILPIWPVCQALSYARVSCFSGLLIETPVGLCQLLRPAIQHSFKDFASPNNQMLDNNRLV
jgi:hypothetical protein